MSAFDLIRNLKSFRSCRDETIPRRVMGRILEAGRNAPSPGNVQSLEFIVVEDDHKLELLSNAVNDRRAEEAPTAVIVLGDVERMARRAGEKAREFCSSEAGCAIQNMRIVSEENDVQSCWIGGFDESMVQGQFKIPESKMPVGVVIFGYSDNPVEDSNKFGLNEIAFYDEYDNQMVSAFDEMEWRGIKENREVYGKKTKGLVDKIRRKLRD